MGRACRTNGEKRNAHSLLMGKSEGKRPLGRPKRGGFVIFRWIFEKQFGVLWTGLIWLKIGPCGSLL
jgi:hypothetical protein